MIFFGVLFFGFMCYAFGFGCYKSLVMGCVFVCVFAMLGLSFIFYISLDVFSLGFLGCGYG